MMMGSHYSGRSRGVKRCWVDRVASKGDREALKCLREALSGDEEVIEGD